MSDEYRERLESLMARLPARNLGPRRSATPVAEEPDEEEPVRPRRTVTRVHASAVGILLVLVLSVVAVGLLRSKPTEVPAGAVVVSTVPEGATLPGATSSDAETPEAAPVSASSGPLPTPSEAQSVQVHVAGRVTHPGVYTVPSDARVADAVEAAGGMASGAHPGRLNLAAPVCDGCQIWIPARGDGTVTPPGQTGSAIAAQEAGPSGTGGAAGGTSAAGATINLNTASQGELESIDGVGPVMAGRIMAWRQEHGRFTSVDQLREISGVGPKTFEKIKPHVMV
ncbi:helix-hairpin-helix domain-containing protein [Cutibacterium sp. V947]|uniref:helix-hairpin-helix domain-containing protein n=1 Tax=Cutibacterium sp. V947 TaxID=3446480 RepID=UPI003EE12F79